MVEKLVTSLNNQLNNQITPSMRLELEGQAYRFVGNHSAVKICGWTKKHLMNEGVCYKYSFYGIRSHQCLQMTTSMFCASRCIFCWRGDKAPVSKNWYGPVDTPKEIVDGALIQQQLLLNGFGGNEKANSVLVKEMRQVRHVALSLTGEPITYPFINEIMSEFHTRGISTFLVTNAQYPEEIKSLKNVTQLYLSIDAPTKELFKKVDRPLFLDYYERMIRSLEEFSKKKFRKCIRLTLIKGINDSHCKEYADLILLGNPEFVEVKSYMHVGSSRENLNAEHMPTMEEVNLFSREILKYLPDYDLVDEHIPSRVVLLKRKDVLQFIDFKKFFLLATENEKIGKDYSFNDYSSSKMCLNN